MLASSVGHVGVTDRFWHLLPTSSINSIFALIVVCAYSTASASTLRTLNAVMHLSCMDRMVFQANDAVSNVTDCG